MVEIKAKEQLLPIHKAQAINYLETYGLSRVLTFECQIDAALFKSTFNA